MTNREFFNVLRLRTIENLEVALRSLQLHPENTEGSMAAHVAIERIAKMRKIARELTLLAEAAEIL